jgi:hypothetical protein
MGRERADLKGLTCCLTTPLSSQRPERTPGGHAPETRRGLRKDEVNGSTKRRRRRFERRSRRGDPSRRRELPHHEQSSGSPREGPESPPSHCEHEIADDEHPDHQPGINRGATHIAVVGPQTRPQPGQVDEAVDLAEQGARLFKRACSTLGEPHLAREAQKISKLTPMSKRVVVSNSISASLRRNWKRDPRWRHQGQALKMAAAYEDNLASGTLTSQRSKPSSSTSSGRASPRSASAASSPFGLCRPRPSAPTASTLLNGARPPRSANMDTLSRKSLSLAIKS